MDQDAKLLEEHRDLLLRQLDAVATAEVLEAETMEGLFMALGINTWWLHRGELPPELREDFQRNVERLRALG